MCIDTYCKPLLERLSLQYTEDKMLSYKNVEVKSKCSQHNCSERNDTNTTSGRCRETDSQEEQSKLLIASYNRQMIHRP